MKKCKASKMSIDGKENCERKAGHKTRWHMYVTEWRGKTPVAKVLWRSRERHETGGKK